MHFISLLTLSLQYGLQKLKEQSLSKLRAELNSANIMQELTSSFTSW